MEKITSEFRAKYPGEVEEKTLKGLWKRIKEKAKKDVDQQRLEMNKTGGGVYDREINPVSEGASAVLGDSILPLYNSFDDDVAPSVSSVSK